MPFMKYDVFISHASEDKLSVARPLANELKSRGKRVWLDELEMTVGDSLRQRIDEALRDSRFGVVILSRAFFKKDWPQRELDGLIAKETRREKVVLPVWHTVDRESILQFSPMLADRLACNTSKGIAAVAAEIERAIERAEKIMTHALAKEQRATELNVLDLTRDSPTVGGAQ